MIDFKKRAAALMQMGSDPAVTLDQVQARIAMKLHRWYEKDKRRIEEHRQFETARFLDGARQDTAELKRLLYLDGGHDHR